MIVNMKEMLADAAKGGYAVGGFNCASLESAVAAVRASEELGVPFILQHAPVHEPHLPLSVAGPIMLQLARAAKTPVAVHLDHGASVAHCLRALAMGFTSVMFDGSALPYEENVRATKEIVSIAHAFGASVEGEIGHVGEAANQSASDAYTTPEEAKAYYEATGVDALAVAIGTAHGVYKQKPKLDIGRLAAIRQAVDVPLVLHGGSGLSDDDFKNCVSSGIAKINVFTDLCLAGSAAMKEASLQGAGYLECRNMKVEAIREEIKKKIRLFGSQGKA